MGIFYSCCWGEREPEIKTDILKDKLIVNDYYITYNGKTYYCSSEPEPIQSVNSYYTALANESYCKMCEKPKNLPKGVLFCRNCNERYFSN